MEAEAIDGWLGNRKLPEGRTVETFRRAVKHQLIKDFQWDAERVEAAGIDLLQLLADEIGWGLEGDAGLLFASFYRLDLGEQLMREILSHHERPEAAQMLAQKSLERAALKVWMRWTFEEVISSGKDSQ